MTSAQSRKNHMQGILSHNKSHTELGNDFTKSSEYIGNFKGSFPDPSNPALET